MGGGLDDGAEDLPNFEKRFCSSLIWPALGGEKAPVLGGGAGLPELERAGGSGADFPIPSEGTDTPAAPSLFIALWLRYPPPLDAGGGAGEDGKVAVEVADGVRGGSLGGNFGGGRTPAWSGTGVLPYAPSLRPGGGGR